MQYQSQDFKSNLEVKWCPGCGDYAILTAVQRALPEVAEALNIPKEQFAFISGIGCSSRFPYYMATYGFHGIHGRATAISTGVKIANPSLSVWQITGDGDALAIGGNHFIHAVRRNINLNILLFNNEIYGLTKGQFSPTTKCGSVTKTSPYGTIEEPFNPGELVIGARGTFFARSLDIEVKTSAECMIAAARHSGTAVVELLQNCVIFNDKTHDHISNRETRADRTITLRHGMPMIFGKDNDKGLMLDGLGLKVVTLGENGITEADLLVHDAKTDNPVLHYQLAHMKYPEFPVALGVIRAVEKTVYDEAFVKQMEEVKTKSPIRCMDDLLNSGDVWDVK